MEPIKIKKRARTIPFGFKQSNDPNYLEPVKEELQMQPAGPGSSAKDTDDIETDEDIFIG